MDDLIFNVKLMIDDLTFGFTFSKKSTQKIFC